MSARVPEVAAKNVLGEPLVACSFKPLTGFFRDGCCKTNEQDLGSHLVCAVMTREFLEFSKSRGNDLSTPAPQWHFTGLKPGDQWCLCVTRWVESFEAGSAPRVKLESTHRNALEYVSIEVLKAYSFEEV